MHCGRAGSCSSLGSHLHWDVLTHHRASWLLLLTAVPAPGYCAVTLVYWPRATALPPLFSCSHLLQNWKSPAEAWVTHPRTKSPTNISMSGQYAQGAHPSYQKRPFAIIAHFNRFFYTHLYFFNFHLKFSISKNEKSKKNHSTSSYILVQF